MVAKQPQMVLVVVPVVNTYKRQLKCNRGHRRRRRRPRRHRRHRRPRRRRRRPPPQQKVNLLSQLHNLNKKTLY